jgi:ribulose-5-phosphate 4-epimerase/fuculose-1-phosphate aldolase
MTEAEAREEICRVGRSLFERGYVHATAGNISVLLAESEGGGYLTTPTDACLGSLEPARLARLDASARQLSGDTASKTMALHAQIYPAASQFDPKTCCVIHTHATHCVALTLKSGNAELLPALTPYFVMKVGHVPVISYHRPGGGRCGAARGADDSTLWRSRYADSRRHAGAPWTQCLARLACRGDGYTRRTRRNRPADAPRPIRVRRTDRNADR